MDKTPSQLEYTVLINKLYDLIGVVKTLVLSIPLSFYKHNKAQISRT
jgi:uncharacterized membrane protein YkvI